MRRKLHWKWWILFWFAAAVIICAGVAFANGSVGAFVQSFTFCAMPVLIAVSVLIVLSNAGVRSKQQCGFCGYDRVGLALDVPCPECGRRGTELGAPGHKAIGHRRLPWWIWMPACVILPVAVILTVTFRAENYLFAGLGLFVLLLVLGGFHAHGQARS